MNAKSLNRRKYFPAPVNLEVFMFFTFLFGRMSTRAGSCEAKPSQDKIKIGIVAKSSFDNLFQSYSLSTSKTHALVTKEQI